MTEVPNAYERCYPAAENKVAAIAGYVLIAIGIILLALLGVVLLAAGVLLLRISRTWR